MIKLLKYDLKQNMNSILGTLAVLVIVQMILSITGEVRGWNQTIVLGVSLFLYSIVNVVLFILTCKTFSSNIRAYNRRLLPLHPVWTVLSSLLFGIILVVGMTILIGIHSFIYSDALRVLFGEIETSFPNSMEVVAIFLSMVWVSLFMFVMIFLAITIGSSLRVHKSIGTWLGIVSFFVIQGVVAWVETKLFGDSANMESLGIVGVGGTTNINSDGVSTQITEIFRFPWETFVFELCIMGLMVWAMTYLINKRIEV